MKLSGMAASAAADAVTQKLDGGILRIESREGVVLVTLPFGTPAYGKAVNGVAALEPMDSARAEMTGEPARFRAFTREGREVWSGSVGPEGSLAELILSTLTLAQGTAVQVLSLPYTHPTTG